MGQEQIMGEQAGRSQTEIDRMYRDMISPARWAVMRHAHTWRPPTDVYETDDAIVVHVEVAGMQEADFHIELQAHVLVISGVRQDPSPKVAYHQMEIHYGEFRVEVYLHWSVDSDSIKAMYTNGFLRVKLPKAQARKLRVVDATP